MSPKPKRSLGKVTHVSLDLYEAGDQLLSEPTSVRGGQTATRSASTLPSDERIVRTSGWKKPTIQLAMLLGLERQGMLTIGGRRRLHKLMGTQPTAVCMAAYRRINISFDPSFVALARWVNRPQPLRQFTRKPQRRIGVGYRDKGSLPPYHTRGRSHPEPGSIFLGERMEYMWSLEPQVAFLVRDYGYLLTHLGDGWWIPDHRLRYLAVTRTLLTK